MADAAEADVPELEVPAGDDLPQDDPSPALEAEDEIEVSFDGEEGATSEGQDSGLVRKLRAEIRDRDARLSVLQKGSEPPEIVVGDKPTLEGCDFDTERFEQDFDAWNERKSKAQAAEQDRTKAEQQRQQAWTEKLTKIEAQKAALGVKDYDQAVETVKAVFDPAQQVLIARAAQDAAKVIYALGKNPAKAEELAKIQDPIELIAAIARLEGKITVTTRKPPSPEQIARGSAPLSQASDKQLERLEKDAARTGNRTPVVQYKRQLREQAKR